MDEFKNAYVVSLTSGLKNAGPKAKDDIAKILHDSFGIKPFRIKTSSWRNPFLKTIYFLKKIYYLLFIRNKSNLVVVQHPFSNDVRFVPRKPNILIIHDIEGLRSNDATLLKKEINIFKQYSFIIAHNDAMKDFLVSNDIQPDCIYTLGLFDYLCSKEPNTPDVKKDKAKSGSPSIAYSGNLDKSIFLRELPDNHAFSLHVYGNGRHALSDKSIIYEGAYAPSILPNILKEDLGLVWDGAADESDSESGFKNYTRYNNPHKLSCYLAAGIPVIVWRQSAVAKFVNDNKIGYTISSIKDIDSLDLKDYSRIAANVSVFKEKTRSGHFITCVFKKIIKQIEK